MKKSLALILLFLCTIPMAAQDMAALKSATEKMYTASYNLDFEAILDQTYPKLFDIAPRDAMMGQIKSAFDNDVMTIVFNLPKVDFAYGDIKTIGTQKFNVVRYLNSMTMKLKPGVEAEMGTLMAENLLSSGQFKKAEFDNTTNQILVETDAIMIAIADETTAGKWTFVNHSEEIFALLFDENIKNTLGL